ncbi:MAG: toprim domain-containing protein, partial [Geminicoccaceae bacterium]
MLPNQVPMPATRVVGWRELPYYDPPAAKQKKPRLVGRYSCLVLATVAPDGRQHAHRIYVAPAGAGKAELGAGCDGRRREPKKSARLKEGESAAGCAVLWGDPATASHLLVAEGIETAAALALAHREEVEAGDFAVAAALSTSGLRTFAPWPANRTITVAADRDEACEAGDRGYRAGERAARAFALAHHERLEIRIALPGQASEDVDWLDVLRRDGVQVVRARAAEAGVVEAFTDLSDAPSSITANQFLRGNSGGTAIEFVTLAPTLGSDFPSAYTGQGGKELVVNAGATAVEFVGRPYDFGFAKAETPTSSEVIGKVVVPRPVTLPADFAGAAGHIDT